MLAAHRQVRFGREDGGRGAVVDERVPDSSVSTDPVTDEGPSGLAVDDERDLAFDDLPPLGLRWVDVLGNVTAGGGLDLGQEVGAIPGEAVALAPDRIQNYVTHG